MAQSVLVGSTGFVGGNLMAAHTFEAAYHSTDVAEGFGRRNELVVYAGVPAAMFLANRDPAADLAVMAAARENLRRLAPRRLVLISSIAVYRDSRGKDEQSPMETEGLPPYGANRLQLEQWVREDFPDALIVRLPALYGKGLKKNFLYDLHTLTPALLKPEKYAELAARSALVAAGYEDGQNGFYRLSGRVDAAELRAFFAANDWNALAFTDSRSKYQFYPLAPPPVSAAEVYAHLTGGAWQNHLAAAPFDYDLRSRHAALLGGQGGYLCTKEEELAEIAAFMKGWT